MILSYDWECREKRNAPRASVGKSFEKVPLQDQEGDGKITSSWISGRQTVRLWQQQC
jgi:hypothetical protein